MYEYISENVCLIKKNLASHNTKLCAVIKNRSNEEVDYLLTNCSVDSVGENRVQELLDHFPVIEKHDTEVHFIGTLQTNKVKYLVGKVSEIQSLDSLKLAEEINRRFGKAGLRIRVLVEINIGEEPQKSGIMPDELDEFLTEIGKYENLIPSGIMTIAPKLENSGSYEQYFGKAKALYEDIFKKHYPDAINSKLSMGMTNNYMEAVNCGSDEVRIGTGIFGPRK